MNSEELSVITNEVNEFVYDVISAQQKLAGIKERLDRNLSRPFEQDYIYEDHSGLRPASPRIWTFDGVDVIVRTLHQTGIGLRDISGADLLYEIDGKKFVIIQYKTPNSKNLLLSDFDQLNNLIKSCPVNCAGTPPTRLNGLCGSWYLAKTASSANYLRACEAKQIIGAQKTRSQNAFSSGLEKATFQELFAKCKLGAPTNFDDVNNYIVHSVLLSNRLVFRATQLNSFESIVDEP